MVITKIQAATDVKIITRLAAYIRVSSDSEDQLHSFSAQYRYYNGIAANSDDTLLELNRVKALGIYPRALSFND